MARLHCYKDVSMQHTATEEREMPSTEEEIGVMSEEAISRALEAAKARLARAERERAELDRVIAAAREEEQLLQRLLALRRDGAAADVAISTIATDQRSSRFGIERTQPVVAAVIQELEAAKRPLHISELMRLLRERNVAIPGSGAQANLITHLRRDDRLVRPSRGMYGLAEWGLQSMPPTRRKRRRRKKMRSTVAEGRNEA